MHQGYTYLCKSQSSVELQVVMWANFSFLFCEWRGCMEIGIQFKFYSTKIVFKSIFKDIVFLFWAGFDVTSTACCATGMFEMGYACNRNSMFTCTDANKYIFWDSFHPTQKTNQLVSNYVVKNVLSQFLWFLRLLKKKKKNLKFWRFWNSVLEKWWMFSNLFA